MMLTRSIVAVGALSLLSALTSALPIPQTTFNLEARDASAQEPLEARLFALHVLKTKTETKKPVEAATTPSTVETRDILEDAELEARDADDDVLEIRDNFDDMLEMRDADLTLAIRNMPDEDLALAIRSAWDNMEPIERRLFRKVWNKIKQGARSVVRTVKKAGSWVSKAAGSVGKVVGVASSIFGGNSKIGGVLGNISKGVNTVGGFANKAGSLPNFRRDVDGIDARDVLDGDDVMDIRAVPDEDLVLAAREVLEEMNPVERREWISTLSRYI